MLLEYEPIAVVTPYLLYYNAKGIGAAIEIKTLRRGGSKKIAIAVPPNGLAVYGILYKNPEGGYIASIRLVKSIRQNNSTKLKTEFWITLTVLGNEEELKRLVDQALEKIKETLPKIINKRYRATLKRIVLNTFREAGVTITRISP